MPKSNISTDYSLTSAWTSTPYRNAAPYGPPSTNVSIGSFEVRKLVRDASDPESRREKPYQNMRIACQYPTGGWHYAITHGGARYRVGSGNGGSTSFSGGLFFAMNYPYASSINARYAPSHKEWPINPDYLSQAEVKAYAALRNKLSEMDLDSYLSFGLWYGERAETASLFRDVALAFKGLISSYKSRSASGLVRSIQSFRVAKSRKEIAKWASRELDYLKRNGRGVTPTTKSVLRFANKAVLQWNLGVAPLVSDLNKAYMALHSGSVDLESLVIKATGWHQRQFIDTERVLVHAGITEVTTNVNNVLRHSCTLVARPVDSHLAFLERAGLLNAPSLLFELTPLSFLLNYVWSIGDYLKAVSTPAAFQFMDGSYTVKVSHVQHVVIKSTSPDKHRKAEGSWTHLEKRRKVYKAFPMPIPPLSLRGTELSARQATNVGAVALLWVRKALGW